MWKLLADGGHYELLPDVARIGNRLDPKLGEQFGIELIRMIREGTKDPGYRERAIGLIHGGADLTVMDQGRTALDEAMRSDQAEIEVHLREQMKLPARTEVERPPRVENFQHPGPCPKTVDFNAYFTLNKSETVRYRFIDETTLAPPDTQEFEAHVGSNTVSVKRVLGVPGQRVSAWVQFDLIAGKVQLTTGRSTFAVDCR